MDILRPQPSLGFGILVEAEHWQRPHRKSFVHSIHVILARRRMRGRHHLRNPQRMPGDNGFKGIPLVDKNVGMLRQQMHQPGAATATEVNAYHWR